MVWDKKKCKICGNCVTECERIRTKADMYEVTCSLCGYYYVTDQFLEIESKLSDKDLFHLSCYIRTTSTEEKPIRIMSYIYDSIEELIGPLRKISVADKLDIVMRHIYENAQTIVGYVDLNMNDIRLFYLRTAMELEGILDYLNNNDYIKLTKIGTLYKCQLTINGWGKYEQIRNKVFNINSTQAFVAMSFDPTLELVYTKGIKPAAKECGYEAIRVDNSEHNQKICDKIISDINKSRFVIADFTHNKHGVYFEGGYALGLGIPVIWMCRRDEIVNLHFDTRQYNHIIWDNETDLDEKLTNRINALIGRPERPT